METLGRLGRRIEAAEELEAVTRMMKGIAAVGLRRFEDDLVVLDEYESIVEASVQVAGAGRRRRALIGGSGRIRAARAGSPVGVVAFGSDLGLCGSVNRRVVDEVGREIDRVPVASLVAVGARLADELHLAGIGPVEAVIDLPSTVAGVSERVDDLLVWIDEHVGRRFDRVEVIVPTSPGRRRGGAWTSEDDAGSRVVASVVVPVDHGWIREVVGRPWPTNQLPMHRATWPRLVSLSMRELLLVRLHRAFVQTMVAVASSRLTAMDTAQRSIAERLEVLHARHRLLRQSEITEELLDVVAGFETLVEEDR